MRSTNELHPTIAHDRDDDFRLSEDFMPLTLSRMAVTPLGYSITIEYQPPATPR